jgi:hypothetical protein
MIVRHYEEKAHPALTRHNRPNRCRLPARALSHEAAPREQQEGGLHV